MPAFAPFLLLLLLPLASALNTRYGTPGRFTAAAGSPDVTTTKLVGYSSLGGTLVQLTGDAAGSGAGPYALWQHASTNAWEYALADPTAAQANADCQEPWSAGALLCCDDSNPALSDCAVAAADGRRVGHATAVFDAKGNLYAAASAASTAEEGKLYRWERVTKYDTTGVLVPVRPPAFAAGAPKALSFSGFSPRALLALDTTTKGDAGGGGTSLVLADAAAHDGAGTY